jgi:hypothetical protein
VNSSSRRCKNDFACSFGLSRRVVANRDGLDDWISVLDKISNTVLEKISNMDIRIVNVKWMHSYLISNFFSIMFQIRIR